MVSTDSSAIVTDEVSLRELFAILRKSLVLITSVTAVFTLIAGIAAWRTPKTYQATIVISPVSDSSGGQLGGLNSLASQFGGLASLAGISVSGDSKKSEALAVLQSEALTEQFIETNNLLPVLYQDLWDARTKTWTVKDPEKAPTLWKANDYFKRSVRAVTSDTKTGMVTLKITWTDPKVAAAWANNLVEMANAYLRNKAIAQSERNIAYLNEQASKTDTLSVKQAIFAILQTEINKVMLAQGSTEYAFKVIDAAVAPERATSPQKSLWVISGFVGGLVLSVFLILARAAWMPAKQTITK